MVFLSRYLLGPRQVGGEWRNTLSFLCAWTPICYSKYTDMNIWVVLPAGSSASKEEPYDSQGLKQHPLALRSVPPTFHAKRPPQRPPFPVAQSNLRLRMGLVAVPETDQEPPLP